MSSPRVALVHDWLTGMRGGELVLEAIIELFPHSEIFTLLHVPGSVSQKISSRPIHTSWMQKIPRIEKRYRHFLPLMPNAIEQFDLSGFDLIISSSHCVAKGIKKPSSSIHLSYIHAPMRYMWNRFEEYFGPGRASPWVRLAAQLIRPRMKAWDYKSSSSQNVNQLIANSKYIAQQIKECYDRDCQVIYPFGDFDRFQKPKIRENFFLMVGAFAPNKRTDIAIDAFTQLGLNLKIIGGGQEENYLKAIAGPNIEFLGTRSDQEVADYLSRAQAFIYTGIEDFGITLVEALSSGTPVISYRDGGPVEILSEDTGILFYPQTAEALKLALNQFQKNPLRFEESNCRKRGKEFSKLRFKTEFVELLNRVYEKEGKGQIKFTVI